MSLLSIRAEPYGYPNHAIFGETYKGLLPHPGSSPLSNQQHWICEYIDIILSLENCL